MSSSLTKSQQLDRFLTLRTVLWIVQVHKRPSCNGFMDFVCVLSWMWQISCLIVQFDAKNWKNLNGNVFLSRDTAQKQNGTKCKYNSLWPRLGPGSVSSQLMLFKFLKIHSAWFTKCLQKIGEKDLKTLN